MAKHTVKKKVVASGEAAPKKAPPKAKPAAKAAPKKAQAKVKPATKAAPKKAQAKVKPAKKAVTRKAQAKAKPAKKATARATKKPAVTPHTHDKLAPATHTHDKLAPAKHTHDKLAPVKHTHDTLAPAKHRHDESYAPKQHHHAWPEIVGKPKAFPPGSHDHEAGTHAHEGLAPTEHAHDGLVTKAELKSLATRVGRLETEPRPAETSAPAGLVIGGRLDTQPIDGSPSFSPTYPFKFDISRLGKTLDPHRLRVVVSGFKKAADDHPESALMIRWSLQGTLLFFQVWDANGNECGVASPTPFGWYNKRVELSFLATYEA